MKGEGEESEITRVQMWWGSTEGGVGWGDSVWEYTSGLICWLSMANSPSRLSTVICHDAEFSCMNWKTDSIIYKVGCTRRTLAMLRNLCHLQGWLHQMDTSYVTTSLIYKVGCTRQTLAMLRNLCHLQGWLHQTDTSYVTTSLSYTRLVAPDGH